MKKSNTKKVALLNQVLQICNGQGTTYTPGNEKLKTAAIAALLGVAQEKMKAVITAESSYQLTREARNASFRNILKIATVISRFTAASSATQEEKLEVKQLKRKYFHRPAKTSKPPAEGGSERDAPKKHVSHADHASQLAAIEHLVRMVESIPAYQPEEVAFQINGLKQQLESLKALHLATVQAGISLKNARRDRNAMLITVDETITGVKNYFRAKFGVTSHEYKQLRPTVTF